MPWRSAARSRRGSHPLREFPRQESFAAGRGTAADGAGFMGSSRNWRVMNCPRGWCWLFAVVDGDGIKGSCLESVVQDFGVASILLHGFHGGLDCVPQFGGISWPRQFRSSPAPAGPRWRSTCPVPASAGSRMPSNPINDAWARSCFLCRISSAWVGIWRILIGLSAAQWTWRGPPPSQPSWFPLTP